MGTLPRHIAALLIVFGSLLATAPAAVALLMEDFGDGSDPSAGRLEDVAPAEDGLRYLSRTVRVDHGIAFEGFGWAGGPHLTVVREPSLADYTDPAAAAWDAALGDVDVSVRTGDGCGWQALGEGEVGFCRVEVPYRVSEHPWDATTDVAVDAERGIHKARVRLNFFSLVLGEADDLSVGVATHELGHAFGLDHPAGEGRCGSIMSYCFERSDPSGGDAAEARERLRGGARGA